MSGVRERGRWWGKHPPACKCCIPGAKPVLGSTVSPAKKPREELDNYSLNEKLRFLVWAVGRWWHRLQGWGGWNHVEFEICRIGGGCAHLELSKEMGLEIGKCFVNTCWMFIFPALIIVFLELSLHVCARIRVREHAGGCQGGHSNARLQWIIMSVVIS